MSHVPVRRGGGVALRINITAAAADRDKPQTGRRDVAETDGGEKVAEIRRQRPSRHTLHPTTQAVVTLQNSH